MFPPLGQKALKWDLVRVGQMHRASLSMLGLTSKEERVSRLKQPSVRIIKMTAFNCEVPSVLVMAEC